MTTHRARVRASITRRRVAIALCATTAAGAAAVALAAPGATDQSFGTNGVAPITATALAATPDGAFVGANGGGVRRYSPTGALDTTFAAHSYDSWGVTVTFKAVAVQPDGKVVAAGMARDTASGDSMFVARMNPDGSQDATFNGGLGYISFSPADATSAYDVLVQPDGAIVAAGSAPGECLSSTCYASAAVVRLRADGTRDAAFGNQGVVGIDLDPANGTSESALAVAEDAGGNLVVGGSYSSPSVGDDAFLARLLPNGALDNSFGTGGTVDPYLLDSAGFTDVAVDGAGRKAMRLGYRHPMGPLELADLVGLDARLNNVRSIYAQTGLERYRPPAILERLVEQRRLGRKSGAGFYDYET